LSNLVNTLKRLNVTSFKVKGDYITVFLEGRKVFPRTKIKIQQHVKSVGSWGKTKPLAKIDNDLEKKKDQLSCACHEVIEPWLMKPRSLGGAGFELPYSQAHEIAEFLEKKFHVKRWGLKSWKEYSKRVDYVWKKEKEEN